MINMTLVNVNHIMRLVELNKNNEINFELEFNAKSKNNEPFQILIVDQQTLDDNDNLQYETATMGSISGNIKSDKNIYKKYFLALKSKNECEVEVNFNINKLPDNIPQPEDIKPLSAIPLTETKVEKTISWRMILILIVIIIGVMLMIYIYNNSESKKNDSELCFNRFEDTIPFRTSEKINIETPKNDIFKKFKDLDL